jgi:hypothetical protein
VTRGRLRATVPWRASAGQATVPRARIGHAGLMAGGVRGHRVLPHTADVIVEAWGPDLVSCCEEAVAGLAALYVDATRAEAGAGSAWRLGPTNPSCLSSWTR